MIILGQRTKHSDKECIQPRQVAEGSRWRLLFIRRRATCSLSAAPVEERTQYLGRVGERQLVLKRCNFQYFGCAR